jgi:hypothetical protein
MSHYSSRSRHTNPLVQRQIGHSDGEVGRMSCESLILHGVVESSFAFTQAFY